MAKYQLKAKVVEAIQWKADHKSLLELTNAGVELLEHPNGADLQVYSPNGQYETVKPDRWVVFDPKDPGTFSVLSSRELNELYTNDF